MSMQYEIETIGDVDVLHLRDPSLFSFEQVSLTSSLFEKFIADSPHHKLVIDCGQIEFFNSLTLGLLASKSAKAREYGKALKFCNINPRSMWSIEATRLDTVLDISPDVQQAVGSF